MTPRAAVVCAGLAAGIATAAPAAAAQDAGLVPPVSVELGSAGGGGWPPAVESMRRARLRAAAPGGRHPVRLHWGVDLQPGGGESVQPFVGVGLAAGRRTTVFYEQSLLERAPDPRLPPAARTTTTDGARLGLEFQARSDSATLRDVGTLRMQVGMNGRLSVKPRRSGMSVTWHTRF